MHAHAHLGALGGRLQVLVSVQRPALICGDEGPSAGALHLAEMLLHFPYVISIESFIMSTSAHASATPWRSRGCGKQAPHVHNRCNTLQLQAWRALDWQLPENPPGPPNSQVPFCSATTTRPPKPATSPTHPRTHVPLTQQSPHLRARR